MFIAHYVGKFPKYAVSFGSIGALTRLIAQADNRPYVLRPDVLKYTNKEEFPAAQDVLLSAQGSDL